MCCSIVGYQFAGWDLHRSLSSIARGQFVGVEMSCPIEWRADGGAAFAGLLADYGLRASSYLTGGYGLDLGLGPLAVDSESDREETVHGYVREAELAARLGFITMVVFVDAPIAGAELDAKRKQAGVTLGQIGRRAADVGVRVVIETHAGSMASEDDSFLAVREAGASENIFANIDPSNYLTMGRDPAAAIRRLGPIVAGVHLKDVLPGPPPQPWAPPGWGRADWPGILVALRDIQYDGALTVEYEAGIAGSFPVDPEIGAYRSADYIRDTLRTLSGGR
jgi:protein FrlC